MCEAPLIPLHRDYDRFRRHGHGRTELWWSVPPCADRPEPIDRNHCAEVPGARASSRPRSGPHQSLALHSRDIPINRSNILRASAVAMGLGSVWRTNALSKKPCGVPAKPMERTKAVSCGRKRSWKDASEEAKCSKGKRCSSCRRRSSRLYAHQRSRACPSPIAGTGDEGADNQGRMAKHTDQPGNGLQAQPATNRPKRAGVLEAPRPISIQVWPDQCLRLLGHAAVDLVQVRHAGPEPFDGGDAEFSRMVTHTAWSKPSRATRNSDFR